MSNMLREHPHVLSLSEFYSMVAAATGRDDAFSPEPMDGRGFWSIVAGISPLARFGFRHRIPVPEWLYPCDAPTARFSRETGVPAILITALPHLTSEHDKLFDMLEREAITWPEQRIGQHYRRLFGRLMAHFNKRLWIERSGGSAIASAKLLATFPDARFVHVTRDGRDAALSMREHIGFQWGVSVIALEQFLGVNPLESSDRSQIDRIPAELLPFLPERFDLEALRAFRLPLPNCGEFWAQQIAGGLNVLTALPAERLLTMRYEDFLIDPKQQIDALVAFLGDEFVDHDWSSRCAGTIRKPRSTWRDLPEAEARALTEACRPGFELLQAAGVHYDD
jgi:putative sulfotransferase